MVKLVGRIRRFYIKTHLHQNRRESILSVYKKVILFVICINNKYFFSQNLINNQLQILTSIFIFYYIGPTLVEINDVSETNVLFKILFLFLNMMKLRRFFNKLKTE
jgi:hypothetical protein